MSDDDLPNPISARPVDGHEWSAGDTPWLRSWQSATTGEPGLGYATCMFCGAATLKLSATDMWADTGRLTVYCDNMNCDMREAELVVTRDGSGGQRRSDVRALHAIDDGRAADRPDPGPGELRIVTVSSLRDQPDTRLESRTCRSAQTLDY